VDYIKRLKYLENTKINVCLLNVSQLLIGTGVHDLCSELLCRIIYRIFSQIMAKNRITSLSWQDIPESLYKKKHSAHFITQNQPHFGVLCIENLKYGS
jgi:hypothetical protein